MDEISTAVEDTFRRLKANPNVSAVFLMTHDEEQLMSSIKPGRGADGYAAIIAPLVDVVRAQLNAADEKSAETLNFLRIRCATKEVVIVPDAKFIFAVVQAPTGSAPTGEEVSLSSPPSALLSSPLGPPAVQSPAS